MKSVLFWILIFTFFVSERIYSQYNDDVGFVVIDYNFDNATPAKDCFEGTMNFLKSKGLSSDSLAVKTFLKENIYRIVANGEKGLFEQLFSNENYFDESIALLRWIDVDVNRPFFFQKGIFNFADTYYVTGDDSFDYYGWGSLTPMYPLDYLYFRKYRHFPYTDNKSISSYNREVTNYLSFVREFRAVHSPTFGQMKSNLIASFRREIERTDFRNRTVENESDGSFKETLIRSMRKSNNIICAYRQSASLNLFPDDKTDDIEISYYTDNLINKKAARKKTTRDNFKTTTSDFIEVEYDENLLPLEISATRNYYDAQNEFNDNFYGFDCWGFDLSYKNGTLNGISYIYGYINNRNVYFTAEYNDNHRIDGSEVFYNPDGSKNDQLNYCARAKSTFIKARKELNKKGAGKKTAAMLFKEAFELTDKITIENLPLYNARALYKNKKADEDYSLLFPPKGFMEDCVKKGYLSGW